MLSPRCCAWISAHRHIRYSCNAARAMRVVDNCSCDFVEPVDSSAHSVPPKKYDPSVRGYYFVLVVEGEIRTHETREGLPVFKTDGSHAGGTHSHVITIVTDGSHEAQT
jgi:hypothetical protein